MIELDIKGYCHGCPLFKPEVETIFSNECPSIQAVVCGNRLVCANIEAYLRDEIQKEKENG